MITNLLTRVQIIISSLHLTDMRRGLRFAHAHTKASLGSCSPVNSVNGDLSENTNENRIHVCFADRLSHFRISKLRRFQRDSTYGEVHRQRFSSINKG